MFIINVVVQHPRGVSVFGGAHQGVGCKQPNGV